MYTMNNIYVEYATGREHTVCREHSDELLEPCDVTGLAEEIAAVEGLCLPCALEAARGQVVSLGAYARRWDLWVAAWHDPRSGQYA